MRRINLIILFAGILPLLGGCTQVGNIRIIDDSPADLETLIEAHEYVRVRQLTGKHPSLDSMELQARLRLHEREYEQSAWQQANILNADGNLHDAVQALSDALQKIPHSSRLRELRISIEQERTHKLKINEREKLLAHGQYLAGQLQLYDDSLKLEPTDTQRRHKHKRNRAEANRLAGLLMEHARFSMENNNLNATRISLELSRKLHDSPEAIALQAELRTIEQALKKTTQKKASIKKARIKRKQTRVNKVQTGKLLAETRQALDANRLHAAREAFTKIPASSSEDNEVMEVQVRLDQAIRVRVKSLTTSGDASYRAEDINSALQAWNKALLLSPDNPEIHERTERASKVLARLEEIKQRQ